MVYIPGMKPVRLFCIAVVLLLALAARSEAGWHGGGGWGRSYHSGGVVVVSPGYYYPAYPPYYYGDPYYYGYPYPVRATYYEPPAGIGAGSIAAPVQEQLARRGYYHGPVDGIVGRGTRAAIAAYQRNHDLEVTGNINAPLLRSLRL